MKSETLKHAPDTVLLVAINPVDVMHISPSLRR